MPRFGEEILIDKEAPSEELVKQIVNGFFKEFVDLERVRKGTSTYVYRVRAGSESYYLRICSELQASFAAEVQVHEKLIAAGVNVPKVVHFEQKNELIGLSLMIVGEIPGSDVETTNLHGERSRKQVLVDAGKQIAMINQVTVDGFGEIRPDVHARLTAKFKTFREYCYENLSRDISALAGYNFSDHERKVVRDFLETGFQFMNNEGPHLVHGDFDLSHIFHREGKYTGIIDFGDIQGSGLLYDLGHFKVHDVIGGTELLLTGYDEVRQITPQDYLIVTLWALFVGVRRLGMIYDRPKNAYHDHLTNALRAMLDELNQMV